MVCCCSWVVCLVVCRLEIWYVLFVSMMFMSSWVSRMILIFFIVMSVGRR